MDTVLILALMSITSLGKLAWPLSISRKHMTRGPYPSISAYSAHNLMWRHFKNDCGFLIAHRANREVSVRHWGTMYVMAEYVIRIGMTRHRGEWSCLDHRNRYDFPGGTPIGDLGVILAPEASNMIYRDFIGNIRSYGFRRATEVKCAEQLSS